MGGYLTIDPDGTVAACDKYVGNKNYVFGKLRRSVNIENEASSALRAAHSEADTDMQLMPSCPFFAYCQGGCAHDNKLNRMLKGSANNCCGLRPLFEDLQTIMQGGSNGGDQAEWKGN